MGNWCQLVYLDSAQVSPNKNLSFDRSGAAVSAQFVKGVQK